MSRSVLRAFASAALGAAIGAACLVVAYVARLPVDFQMDRDLPSVAIGLYPVERAGDLTYAWTSGRADVTLRGLDRATPWHCTVRLRGARPDPSLPLPVVRLAIDGVAEAEALATAEPMSLAATAPPRPEPGLRITLSVSPTFVPGGGDSRTLGVILDGVRCTPERWPAWPPRRAVAAAAAAMGSMAAGLSLMGLAAVPALGVVGIVSALQAWAVTLGIGPYSPYVGTLGWLAAWIVFAAAILVRVWERSTGGQLHTISRLAVGAAAGMMYLKLVALLHPSKDLVDALFHAHRLDWVLAGRFHFTQLSTSATPFPYAIGLYVFSAPWAWLTRDHVTLLRVVVCAWDAVASLLLFALVARTWQDRLAGLIAVLFFGLVPLSYAIVGNANLTSAFGTSVAVATVALWGLWAGTGLSRPMVWGLTLVTTLGFISHISTLTLLLSTLVFASAVYWRWGGPALRSTARTMFVATLAALALSAALYWGHFGPVYLEQIQRARTATTSSGAADVGPVEGSPTALSGLGHRTIPPGERVASAAGQTVANVGWPMVGLFVVGLWHVRSRMRDPLGLMLAAWGTTWAVFLGAAILAPANAAYQQDAWEFIGRVQHVTMPAAVIPAAVAAAWMWRRSRPLRVVSCMLLLAAAAVGARAWASWLLAS